ncbi:MAG: hypothetical protein V4735_02700 [Pseudomonadota bacterium]
MSTITTENFKAVDKALHDHFLAEYNYYRAYSATEGTQFGPKNEAGLTIVPNRSAFKASAKKALESIDQTTFVSLEGTLGMLSSAARAAALEDTNKKVSWAAGRATAETTYTNDISFKVVAALDDNNARGAVSHIKMLEGARNPAAPAAAPATAAPAPAPAAAPVVKAAPTPAEPRKPDGDFQTIDTAMEAYFLAQYEYFRAYHAQSGSHFQKNEAGLKQSPNAPTAEGALERILKPADQTSWYSSSISDATSTLQQAASKAALKDIKAELSISDGLAASRPAFNDASLKAIASLDDNNNGPTRSKSNGEISHVDMLKAARGEQGPAPQTLAAPAPAPAVAPVVAAPAPAGRPAVAAPAVVAAPAPAPKPAKTTPEGGYTIVQDDTLFTIVQKLQSENKLTTLTWKGADDTSPTKAMALIVARKNGIEDADKISHGTTLILPSAEEIKNGLAQLKLTALKDDNVISYKDEMKGKATSALIKDLSTPVTPAVARTDASVTRV